MWKNVGLPLGYTLWVFFLGGSNWISNFKIIKLCAIYWVLANLDSNYRSALHSIQLALLCKVNTVKEHAIRKFFVLSFRTLQVLRKMVCMLNDKQKVLIEGIVPAELSLCLKDLINKKYISLESLNRAIRQFPYTFSNKTDKPQIIPKTSFSRGTTGGNGHKNWSLLRLLPLMIGYNIPEGDQSWEILMLLKDTIELVMSAHFTKELIHFLVSKISEHRELLQKTFQNYRLHPKHHFVEHYPQMIQIFGPLVDVWTMRFEGKHKFFKKVVHDTCNFKNVAHTLAVSQQKMMAFHLDSSTFFKPPLQIDKVRSVMVKSFPENVQSSLHQQNGKQSSVLVASSACVHGVKYCADMIVSIGSCSDFQSLNK